MAAVSHFGGQLLGILLALLVSHLIARRLGVGAEADAFFFGRRIATSLIETLSQIMAVFYIPLVAAHAARAGGGFLRATLRHAAIAAALGLGLSLLIAWGAAPMVRLLAPGFDGGAAVLAGQALTLFGAALPATMGCIVFAACLNVTGRFGMPSAIRQLPRAAVAAVLALAGTDIAIRGAGAFAVAWFAVAGLMLLQCLRIARDWQAEAPTPPAPAAPVRPLAAGISAVLLMVAALASTWLETGFAAQVGPGGVTRLELTQRLGTLPGNTLVAALSLVVFTAWSRRAAAGQRPSPSDFWRNIFVGLAVLLPVQVYVALHSQALVGFLLGHGRFDAAAVDSVAHSLRWMTLAPLSAFVLRMVLVRVLADPALPVVRLIAIGIGFDTGLKALLFQLLTPGFGVVGIVTAQAISPVATVLLMAALLRGSGLLAGPVHLGREAGLAAAVAAAVAGFILGALPFSGIAPSMRGDLAMLACSGLLGAALFLITAKVLRVSVALH
ncbi:lipid II flippase MurJ [Paracoccus sp. (in: a-proteobacteria)]